MTQVTLVALYGQKKNDFGAFVQQCQKTVEDEVDGFQRYDLEQVHATIIGLERVGTRMQNANFETHRKRKVEMDFDGFIDYLRSCGEFPFQVQLGGFGDRDYPFRSRKSPPFERSFSVQGDKVVVMGWPIRGEPFSVSPASSEAVAQESRIYPPALDNLRRASQRFGILHGYHRSLTDVDNDLFFRIGLIDKNHQLGLEAIRILEQQMRKLLTESPPLIIELALEDVRVAAYQDNALPTATTRSWPVTDQSVTGSFVHALFSNENVG